MVAAETYAVAVNFVPAYRIPADQIGASTVGLQSAERTLDIEKSVDARTGQGFDGAEIVEVEKLEGRQR